MKQKTEIIFESEETIVLRQVKPTLTAFCPQCQAQVEMASPQTIAASTDFTEREIFRLIENQRVHFVETDRVLICLNSLPIKKEE